MPAHAPATLCGRDLVLSLARELQSLRDLARALPVAPDDHANGGAIAAAQGQDLLEQTLDELALFLTRTAPAFGEAPMPSLEPALARVRLSALARRLAGGNEAPAAAEGELELL